MKLTILVFVLQLVVVHSQNCESSNNGTVKVEGCLDPDVVISHTDITAIKTHDLKGTELSHGYFRNLKNLESIEISRSILNTLKPNAFKDLRYLKSVIITDNRNLRILPKGIFNSVSTIYSLDLSHNNIEFIETQAFANMPSLRNFTASNNALRYWSPDWFEDSTRIEELYFGVNRIVSLPARAFAAMPWLRKIDFRANRITTIGHDAFGELTRLEHLHLGWNQLFEIDDEVFRKNISISYLNLRNNKLNFLSSKMLSKMSIRNVTLDSNPWKCSCLIGRIYEWIRASNDSLISHSESFDYPVCGVPRENSHECLDDERVDDELTLRFAKFVSLDSSNDRAGDIAKRMCETHSKYAADTPGGHCDFVKEDLNDDVSLYASAPKKEFPHMVLIMNETTWAYCSGSLISDKFILTTARCASDDLGGPPKYAGAGITALHDEINLQFREVVSVVFHPAYTNNTWYYDIALLKVDRPFYLNSFVRPACLHTERNSPYKYRLLVGLDRSGKLKKTKVEIIDNAKCDETFIEYIRPENQLPNGMKELQMNCGSILNASKPNCEQDYFGSPLVIYHDDTEDIKCMYSIVGIHSIGYHCSTRQNIFTNILPYIQWIEGKVWQ